MPSTQSERVAELVRRYMDKGDHDEATATRLALEESVRVNVGLLMENDELKRTLRGQGS